MKILAIAFKDTLRSFRSAFALVFMFGVPLLMTGMFYFMLGENAQSDTGFSLPATQVIVANEDRPTPERQAGLAGQPVGELLVAALQEEAFADLITVSFAPDAAAARAAVDRQEAGVAVLIPPDFSDHFIATGGQAEIGLYHDPTLQLGPQIVRSLLEGIADEFAGARIAADVTLAVTGETNYVLVGQVVERYVVAQSVGRDGLVTVRPPAASAAPQKGIASLIAPMMGGMLIFYAFFTGASSAQSILKEDEEGTLPRLFTTPTPQSSILVGKFLAVFLTVIVQVCVLLLAARLIFGIRWGAPFPVALLAGGTVLAATGFGICLNSLIRTTKQSGVLFGGVLTMTGMLGLIDVFMMGALDGARWVDVVTLLVPQGWAARSLQQALDGLPAADLLPTTLALCAWSVAFFALGAWRFQKRFA